MACPSCFLQICDLTNGVCVDAVWLSCLLEEFWPDRSPYGVLSPLPCNRQISLGLLYNHLNLKEFNLIYASENHSFLAKLAESVTFRCI